MFPAANDQGLLPTSHHVRHVVRPVVHEHGTVTQPCAERSWSATAVDAIFQHHADAIARLQAFAFESLAKPRHAQPCRPVALTQVFEVDQFAIRLGVRQFTAAAQI